jgi:signal transduction histidine kinase
MGAVPFLEEEEKLVREIARQIGLLLERLERREEHAQLEAQLRHTDRLATIGKLTAGVAHELNEPIGSILGFTELIEQSVDLPRQAAEDLSRIHRAALHAREIIKKLMFFGRQTPPGQIPVDLNAIVEEGLSLLQPRLAKEKIRVIRKTDLNLPAVLADPRQLQQVVVNLAVNAIQAMPDGGELTVATHADGDGVVLRVEDTGVGMSEETLAQIFVPFFTTKEVGQGIGLGLSVVHGIVTAHHGTIRVESEEGVGSRFVIQLPARGADEARSDS